MTCSNGRKPLSKSDERQLFAQSAGTCLLCSTDLFPRSPVSKVSISIGELAHIIAHSDDGPRSSPAMKANERDGPENIVLLCPTCHTIVDKHPQDFPVEQLHLKKGQRKSAIEAIGGTATFNTRESARKAAQTLLRRNRILFEQYGPNPLDGSTDSVESAQAWSTRVIEEIVPNNRFLIALVMVNSDLATESECEAAELLRQHTDSLERKHRDDVLIAPVRRFPQEIESIFQGDYVDTA